jgi:bacterial/archaeal transporter family-2 protein
MQGIIYSIIAGILISIQGVFNSKASEKIGLWQTNTLVHGLGFVVSVIILMMVKDGSFNKITDVNKLYLIGGALGVIIVYSVMKGITSIGPAYSVSILLISQLIIALLIDTFGLFGVEKVPFSSAKLIGLVMMISGVLVFKMK